MANLHNTVTVGKQIRCFFGLEILRMKFFFERKFNILRVDQNI